MGLII